ncbi:MAG: hypothetical protein AB7T74_02255 [Clostridia bacterium]
MTSKQITVTIPARTVKGATKVFTYPARTDVYEMDEQGNWTGLIAGQSVKLREDDVIDACKRSADWSKIRAIHFPMYGFHDAGEIDNTPSHKSDF